MFFTRQELEEIEDKSLASYGMRSKDSKGRAYLDSEPDYRTTFQRDRDRILHTTAFRRLEYKTQVFINFEGDYFRTRLTHTLEVAQIGRTLARALGANEDLVEAVCLAHDVCHPPFGHAGESALARLMAEHGGFDHNRQSLRIVTELEHRFPEFPGLNLTWEVREGIVMHETEYDIADAAGYDPEKRGTLEAQLANVADELAYTAHDLDDGLRSSIIFPRQLEGLGIWTMVAASLGWTAFELDELARHRFIRRLIGLEVNDLLQATAERIERSGEDSVNGLQRLSYNVAAFSEEMGARNRQLKDFLYRNMYQHHRVVRMQVKADSILEDLFQAYTRHPEILPESLAAMPEAESRYRTVCDYVAGMTDRFALQEHAKLFDPGIQP